jgi:hypothetical protein
MPKEKGGPGSPRGGTAGGRKSASEHPRERSAVQPDAEPQRCEPPSRKEGGARRSAPDSERRELPRVSPGAIPTRD